MNAPDRIQLLRVLLDQMELDLRDDAQPQPPPPISREFAHKLSKSQLWPLHGDKPLAELFQQAAQLSATIVRQEDRAETYHDEPFLVTVRESDDGEAIELRSNSWPDGWEPLAIVVGHFDDGVTFEPAAFQDVVRKTPELDLSPIEHSFSLAADDEESLVEGRDSLADLQPLRFSSRDLTCFYHRWEALLETTAKLPAGQNGGLAVAEMSYMAASGQRVVQRRLIPLRIQVRESWKGSARFRPPARSHEDELRFLVRPFKTSDLDLLPPEHVRDLLADADFASMRLEPIADGFSFRPILPHQREMLADPDARWCLRAVRVGRGDEDDV